MRIALLTFFCIVFPLQAYAHPSGISYETESGPYLLDMGYDPATFVSDEYTVFDFNLYHQEGKEPVLEFDHVWVRIEDEERGTIFASGIRKASIGPTTLLVSLVRPAGYTISASYRTKEGEELASSKFPFSVADTEPLDLLQVVMVTLGFLAGAILGALALWTKGLYTPTGKYSA